LVGFLWRFIIAGAYQGKGYDRAALELVFNVLRHEGYRRIWTSYVPGEGGPSGFYMALGFSETGKISPNGERLIERSL
jgi:diamine N-acetyltransferase